MARKLPVAHDGSRLNRLQWGEINKFRAIGDFRQEPRSSSKAKLHKTLFPEATKQEKIFKMPSPCGDDKCKDKCGGDCKCGADCKCCESGSAEKCNCKSGGECTCKQGACQC